VIEGRKERQRRKGKTRREQKTEKERRSNEEKKNGAARGSLKRSIDSWYLPGLILSILREAGY
jgi:hypothetical protein